MPMTSHCVWFTAMTLWRSFGICGLKSISVLCHPTEVLCLGTVWRLGQWSSSRMRGPHGCSGLSGSFRNCTQVVMVMSAPFRWRLLRVCLYVPFSVFIIWKVNERIRDSVTNDLLSPVRPVTPVRDTHDPTHTHMTHISINDDEKKDSGGTDPHTQNRNVTKMSRYGRVIKPRPILDM